MTGPKLLAPILITLAVCLSAGSTAAQSALERHIGPIAAVVELGQSDAWTTAADGNWFTMTNGGDIGAIRYYWANLRAAEGRDFALAANLFTQATQGDLSHAGLVFHYRAADRYLAVTIASDRAAYLFVRSPEDGVQVNRIKENVARLDGSDRLEIAVSGNMAAAVLNGEQLFSAEIGGTGPTRNLGVFAAGSGQAAFTNMALR